MPRLSKVSVASGIVAVMLLALLPSAPPGRATSVGGNPDFPGIVGISVGPCNSLAVTVDLNRGIDTASREGGADFSLLVSVNYVGLPHPETFATPLAQTARVSASENHAAVEFNAPVCAMPTPTSPIDWTAALRNGNGQVLRAASGVCIFLGPCTTNSVIPEPPTD